MGRLLHDIGKAVDMKWKDLTSNWRELARKYKESREIVNAIAAHHGDEEFLTLEAVLVQAADAISAARPGARRETLKPILSVWKIEEIADSFDGVEKP